MEDVLEGRYMYPQYMCILLYMIITWCNGISEIYCQLEFGGRCILSICAFCYMSLMWGSGIPSIGMWGVDVSSVYVHSVICDNLFGVMVFHRCIVN